MITFYSNFNASPGNCNSNEQDDLTLQSGLVTDDVEEFGLSWQVILIFRY